MCLFRTACTAVDAPNRHNADISRCWRNFIPMWQAPIFRSVTMPTMNFSMEEALSYYQEQGAPNDQSALIALLTEIQDAHGGAIPAYLVSQAAEGLKTKEALLFALIRRIPRLRLKDTHCLELCAGPNCSKRAALADFVENTWGARPEKFQLRYVPCMRQCGKGPNVRWDGRLYNQTDETLLRRLLAEAGIPER